MPHRAQVMINKIPSTYAFHMCVEYDKTKQTASNKICYDIYIRQILYKNTCIFVPCLNYREFDFKGDLGAVPHTWYLSAQSFITLLKLVWGEYDIVAMNEWKKKCVGLQRTWVSKRTVYEDFTNTRNLCTQYAAFTDPNDLHSSFHR